MKLLWIRPPDETIMNQTPDKIIMNQTPDETIMIQTQDKEQKSKIDFLIIQLQYMMWVLNSAQNYLLNCYYCGNFNWCAMNFLHLSKKLSN